MPKRVATLRLGVLERRRYQTPQDPWGQTDLEFSPQEILNRSDPEDPRGPRGSPCPAVLWRSRPSNALVSCFFMSSPPWETRKRPRRSVCPLDRYNVGEVAGSPVISPSKIVPVAAERPLFPPLDQALIQAMACEVVAPTKEPLNRQSLADLVRRAQTTSGKKISRTTV